MRLINKNINMVLTNHLINYPVPSNLTYFYSFGFLAGITLSVQLISGVALAMHYTPHVDYAFHSVEHIMRDVRGGWFLRYSHANGASIFFAILYIHVLRGMYYKSYRWPKQLLWVSGVAILFLLMGTAFLGYVLP